MHLGGSRSNRSAKELSLITVLVFKLFFLDTLQETLANLQVPSIGVNKSTKYRRMGQARMYKIFQLKYFQ